MTMQEQCYCTLVMSDNYLPGAAVLAHSLRDAGSRHALAVLILPDTLRPETITELESLYDHVIPVDRISTPNLSNLHLINRVDLLHTFTKINLWRLVQFKQIVYIDADVVALRAPDELFDIQDKFAAASDIGWPDFFNSGVMLLKPDMGTYWALHTLATGGISFDGADQGLLNQYYEHKSWHRLPFTYNCTPSSSYQYEPAYRYHQDSISLVHFIGKQKPWMAGRAGLIGSGAYRELLGRWWAVYDQHYKDTAPDGSNKSYTVQRLVTGEETNYNTQQRHNAKTVAGKSILKPPKVIITPPVESEHDKQRLEFAPPQAEWDATKAPPPESSRPEAPNFPNQEYEFNADVKLFKAPGAYPEPPRDMWYEIPNEKKLTSADRPKAIFPWERRQHDEPTRVFADDYATENSTSTGDDPEDYWRTTGSGLSAPGTPMIRITDENSTTVGQVPKNAWDDVAGIDSYVRQLKKWQNLRGKLETLQNSNFGGNSKQSQSQTPASDSPPQRQHDGANQGVADSAMIGLGLGMAADDIDAAIDTGSLRLTDFPTDRPSLPVTPAPIQRNTFWGSERGAEDQLAAAEGVVDQAEWNPTEKLEQLRLASLNLDPAQFSIHSKNVPRRDMPTSSMNIRAPPGLRSKRSNEHVRFKDPDSPLLVSKETPKVLAMHSVQTAHAN